MDNRCKLAWENFFKSLIHLCEVLGKPSALAKKPGKCWKPDTLTQYLIIPVDHHFIHTDPNIKAVFDVLQESPDVSTISKAEVEKMVELLRPFAKDTDSFTDVIKRLIDGR